MSKLLTAEELAVIRREQNSSSIRSNSFSEYSMASSRAYRLLQHIDAMSDVLRAADQKLSGIQYYSSCKTAQGEAALIRREISTALAHQEQKEE